MYVVLLLCHGYKCCTVTVFTRLSLPLSCQISIACCCQVSVQHKSLCLLQVNVVDTTVTPRRTTAVSGSSLSAVLLLNDKNHIIFSSWDNNIYGLVILCVYKCNIFMICFSVHTYVAKLIRFTIFVSFDMLFV